MSEMDRFIRCTDLWPFVRAEKLGHKPEHALLVLGGYDAISVPLQGHAAVPMRSTRGGENDATLTEGEYTAEDALVTII